MIFLLWLVLSLVILFLIVLPLALWRYEVHKRYSGSRLVACPQDQRPAAVSIDARHAAATGIHGHPDLRISACTCWPERAGCGEACILQAAGAASWTPGTGKAGSKPIHHLPILLAAFAAWCLGALWHSQWMFRARWMDSLGLTRAQLKQIVWWDSPHLLTIAVCLLFAYGVAWLLAAFHRKGVLPGVLMALLLCGTVAAASWYGIAALPHGLLAIEAGYALLATLAVGTIVGGLYDRLVLPSH